MGLEIHDALAQVGYSCFCTSVIPMVQGNRFQWYEETILGDKTYGFVIKNRIN